MIFPFVYGPYASSRYEATTSLPLYYPSPPFSLVLSSSSLKDFFVKHIRFLVFLSSYGQCCSFHWCSLLSVRILTFSSYSLFSSHLQNYHFESLVSFLHFTSWKLWYLLLHMYNSNVNGNSSLKYTWSVIHKVFKTPLSFLNSIKLPKLWLFQNYYNLLQTPKCSEIDG